MPRVLLNFQLRKGWWVHFVAEDCRSEVGRRTKYFRFDSVDDLRSFVARCSPENAGEFEENQRRWCRGSLFVRLTDEQYAKLEG
jgi:hypothetical protein